MIVRRDQAPLGRALPYRRAGGEHPVAVGGLDLVRQHGWEVDLGERALGDMLLGLALVRALVDATGRDDLEYTGPRPDLMCRCTLPSRAKYATGPHIVRTNNPNPVPFLAIPEKPPTWLDLLDDEHVEVHSALPMRYYLAAERVLGVRLPASHAPAPSFSSTQSAQQFHVVFLSATSWAARKDYGPERFANIAMTLAQRHTVQWRFTLVTGTDAPPMPAISAAMNVLSGPTAADCLDVFASAEVVIGNDTGLTHLAALTQRPDGTSPHVIGLYGRHAHTKWTTGADHHHAIATTFSQMLSAADRCPVRDRLDDALWAASASLSDIPAELIADAAAHIAGWW
jgi:hypothetical protein